ncbi:alpha-latrotoxin-Lhe1a-like [Anoplophora glabripennis]|uniref:alpha-latrotoxin-Lhe1a-like n=1 Tax=Anoplophora glabripennis TaxID=217634 RepID=UPI000C784565|nr:alpha-latrotoxin-Lhe1a-like [Anoplophora glabripennis]
MGKSTFLSFINSELLSNQWVIHMDLKKYSARVKNLKTVEDLIDFSYNCQTDDLSESFHTFLKPLYKHLKEQIIWLIDDYEEVSEPGLLDLFKLASKEGFNIWIVARPYLKVEFESFFGVFSMQLAEFDKTDQTKFVQKYLTHKNKNENDIKVIMTAIETIRHLLEDSFIGTCQQIMMLTEIFLNPENNLKEHKWHVHDIFEKFINLKVDNDYGVRKEWYIRTISKLALKVFFKDDALKNVFDMEEFNEDIGCSKMSFLHLAVTSGNLEAIMKLTKIHCFNDWGVDSEGNTPLHIACNKNDDNILEYFFNQADLDVDVLNKKNLQGLHIDSECCNGNTPFVISVIFKKIDVARVLQSNGANTDHYNSNNKSALHFAASKGFLNCVKQLIDWKVTVNCSDDYGKTPLMKASSWGHINIVKLLLANSAKIDERSRTPKSRISKPVIRSWWSSSLALTFA